jgi:hypothetical protein
MSLISQEVAVARMPAARSFAIVTELALEVNPCPVAQQIFGAYLQYPHLLIRLQL